MEAKEKNSGVTSEKIEKKPQAFVDRDRVPVDRGYAWVILLAATLEMAILIGIVKCNGIFFIQFQKRFGSSASMTSLIHTFHNVGYSFTSLVVMTVGLKYMSNRTSVMIGAAVYGCCFLITGFVEDFGILFVSQGTINGIAFAFIHPPVIAMLGVYFEKHRGVANSISVVGVSIGGLACAPLVTVLFEEYTFTGTFLIVSGILFNLLICGALLRPTEFYTKVKSNTVKLENHFKPEEPYIKGKAVLLNEEASEKLITTNSTLIHENTLSSEEENIKNHQARAFNSRVYKLVTSNLQRLTASQELPVRNINILAEPLLDSDRNRSWSVGAAWRRKNIDPHSDSKTSLVDNMIGRFDNSLSARLASSDVMSASLLDVYTQSQSKPELQCNEVTDSSSKTGKTNVSFGAKLKCGISEILSVIFDFKLLKNPVFCLFLLCAGLMCVGVTLTITFVPPVARDLRIPGSEIAFLLSVNNIVDMAGRILFGVISDRGWIRRSTILGLTAIAIGIPSHFIGLIHSFHALLVYGVILGLFQGVYFALYAVVIVDYLKLENLRSTLGFTVLMQGFFTCTAYPAIGALRDATGSYVSSYHLLGFILNTSALMAFLLPAVEKWNNKRQQCGNHLGQPNESL